jgi:hypothetical protein
MPVGPWGSVASWSWRRRVRLAPLGAYKLLGPALSEIGGSLVGLEDIVGAEARRLRERVQSAPTWKARSRLLDAFLLERARHGPQPSPEVSHAWHLLVRSRGTTTIKGRRSRGGLEPQAPHHQVQAAVGVAPHMAARLVRLSMVWRHLDHAA